MFLSLNDITIPLNGRPAFEHSTWVIEKDQHWAVLGPTGAGKSLLAGAIQRRAPLSHGQIHYFFDGPVGEGRTYLHPREILTLSAETHREFLSRYAGYHQARWQSMEGEDAPSVGALLDSACGGDGAHRGEIIRLLGLDALLERKVMHLSHGESRKAHLASLLLQKPRLLILDDPYVGLDAQARPALARAIDELLQRETPQILLISSRVEEIPQGARQILLVDGLRILAQGERETVMGLYQPEAEAPALLALEKGAAFEQRVEQFAEALARDRLAACEMVRMDAVTVRYGAVRVLQEVDWRVRPGERWSLAGANGAGKTTLLSLILADNPQAYANEIFLFGRRRGSGESIWEIKKNIGWVSPELQIHYPKDTSCFEVVCSGFFDSVGLYRRPDPAQGAAAKAWLEAFGMQDLADCLFQRLSTGQQRLALLARALVKDPPLLILDEPCQGLDAAHRHFFIDLLDQICLKTPLTMIYVTHYQDELPGSITHRLRLEAGRVVENGRIV